MSQMGPLSTPWSAEETEQDEAVSGRLDVVGAGRRNLFPVAQTWSQSKQPPAGWRVYSGLPFFLSTLWGGWRCMRGFGCFFRHLAKTFLFFSPNLCRRARGRRVTTKKITLGYVTPKYCCHFRFMQNWPIGGLSFGGFGRLFMRKLIPPPKEYRFWTSLWKRGLDCIEAADFCAVWKCGLAGCCVSTSCSQH